MNYGISVLFRAIPLAMALFCFGYGAFISAYGDDSNRLVAGPVVFSLGMICITLFATAATIIRQIIHTYGRGSLYALPIIGYLAAVVTIVGGICMFTRSTSASSFVAGHVVAGVGLITTCVATAATSSTRFSLIPANSKMIGNGIPKGAFTKGQELILKTIAITISLIMDMGFRFISQERCTSCLFRSRACDGRFSLHLHKPDCFGCYYCPSNQKCVYG